MNARILVIDDDQAVRDAFELALADEGYDVALADSGEAGIASVLAARPDLIFLDLKMPGLDGVETMRRLQGQDRSLRIYVVTAFAQEFMPGLQKAKQDGFRFQLAAKPLSPNQIRMIAQAALGS